MNNHLKYFARDANNKIISGNCIFCTLNNINNPSQESYKHLFQESKSSISVLAPIVSKFNIELSDKEEEGDKVLYFNMQDGKWNELRTNIFFLIYKCYINNCKLRKELPNETNFERTLTNETRKKVQ